MTVGIRDVLKALDAQLIGKVARFNGIKTDDGDAEKVIEGLVAYANENPLVMFSMIGGLP